MRTACPYRGENNGPGKNIHGELDPTPGIREQPGSFASIWRWPPLRAGESTRSDRQYGLAEKSQPLARGKRSEGGAAMPEWQRRILRTFAVRSRPIAHRYDPLKPRGPFGACSCVLRIRQPRRQLPVSGKTGMFDFVEAARSRLDIRGIGHEPCKPSAQMAQGGNEG
jgi:hypothetical protein